MGTTPGETRKVPLIEETVSVDRVEVDRGGFRIAKTVSTREETVDELLRTSDVHIERRPIGTAITGDAIPGVRQEGDTTIVPVVEEMLIAVKRLVLVEEVRITRIHGTHRAPQTVTLKKEDIVVERLAAGTRPAPEAF